MLPVSSFLAICLVMLALCAAQSPQSQGGYYEQPPPQKSLNQLDVMVDRCFRTTCREWMLECHWYCDSVKEKARYWNCLGCLSWRGRHCFECFDL